MGWGDSLPRQVRERASRLNRPPGYQSTSLTGTPTVQAYFLRRDMRCRNSAAAPPPSAISVSVAGSGVGTHFPP